MAIKILATADLHLGKSAADTTGPHSSTKYTWARIIDFCIAQEIDALALCGDIVDWDNRYFEAIGPLQTGFEKLIAHDIAVFMVSGNHDFDVLADIAAKNKLPNIHLLGANGHWEIRKFQRRGETVQFAGWSFPGATVKESAFRNWHLQEYDPQYPCIGLLHGDADKSTSSYHPFKLDELVRNEVDVWILGHIHRPGKLRGNPEIWYTGSPHAMSAKEPGLHGPLLIDVGATGQIDVEQVAISPVIYVTLEVKVSPSDDETGLRERIVADLVRDAQEKENEMPELLSAVYHVRLTGEHADIKEVERWMTQILQFSQQLARLTISIRKCYVQLKPALNLEELATSTSPAGVLARTILAIRSGASTPFLEHMIADWQKKAAYVYRAGTYTSLLVGQRIEEPGGSEAKIYIEAECNRLLAELAKQIP